MTGSRRGVPNRRAGLLAPVLRTLAVVAVSLSAPACLTRTVATQGPFWQAAVEVPMLHVPGLAPPPRADEIEQLQVEGVVRGHESSPLAGADHLLDLTRPEGTRWQLHYRIGAAGLRLPIAKGDTVHMVLLQRLRGADGQVDRGLLVYRWRMADGRVVQVLIAAVETDGILAAAGLPASLAAIRPSDRVVYHDAGAFGDDCDVLRAHRYFHVRQADLPQAAHGRARSAWVAPGTQVVLDDGTDRYLVALLDNRTTIQTSCAVTPAAASAWTAIRQVAPPQAAGTAIRRVLPVPAPFSVGVPAAPASSETP